MQGIRTGLFATLAVLAGLTSLPFRAQAQVVAKLESGRCTGGPPELAASATLVRVADRVFALASFNAVAPANAPESCHAVIVGGRKIPVRWVASRWSLGLAALEASLSSVDLERPEFALLRSETPISRSRPSGAVAIPGVASASVLNAQSERHFFGAVIRSYETRLAGPVPASIAGTALLNEAGAVLGILSNQFIVQATGEPAVTTRATLIADQAARANRSYQLALVIPSAPVFDWLAQVASGAQLGQTGVGHVRPADVVAGRERVQIAGLSFEAVCNRAAGLPAGEYPIGGNGDGFGIGGSEGNTPCRIDAEIAPGEGAASLAEAAGASGATWARAREPWIARLREANQGGVRASIWFSYERNPIFAFPIRDAADLVSQLRDLNREILFDTTVRTPPLPLTPGDSADLRNAASVLLERTLAYQRFTQTHEPYVYGKLLRSPFWRDVSRADIDRLLRNAEADSSVHLDLLMAVRRVHAAFVQALAQPPVPGR